METLCCKRELCYMEIGYIYLYKNGLEDIVSLKIVFGNREEIEVLNQELPVFASNYIEKGYSIIRYMQNVIYNKGMLKLGQYDRLSCYIAKDIDQNTGRRLMSRYQELQNNYMLSEIYNDYPDELGPNYDYFIKLDISGIDLLIREKLNTLTEKEKDMFERFRNFNLFRLLLISHKDDVINCGNSGSILITKNQYIKSTNRRQRRELQFRAICSQLYPGLNMQGKEVSDLLNETGDVFIRVIKETIIVELPLEIDLNSYQRQKLFQFCDEVSSIEEQSNQKIAVYSSLSYSEEDPTIEYFRQVLEGALLLHKKIGL